MMTKLKAEEIAEILFTMTPVPTPNGLITGAGFQGTTIQFKYQDGTKGPALQPEDLVEVSL